MARYAFLARQVDQTAAVLAVPEVAWTAFATVLSTAVAAKRLTCLSVAVPPCRGKRVRAQTRLI
jgi:hypothetical protein